MNDLSNEEKIKYILEFLPKTRMNDLKEILKKKTRYNFIIPLKRVIKRI